MPSDAANQGLLFSYFDVLIVNFKIYNFFYTTDGLRCDELIQ